MKQSGGTSVTLHIPNASVLSSKVGTLAYASDRACFAMNITASDIQSTSDNICELNRGVFAGTAGANGVLTAQVKKGPARKLELYAYFKPSALEPCPALTAGFGTLDRRKIYLVGTVASFDASTDEVNLKVDVSMPTSTTAALSRSLPSTCSIAEIPAAFAGRMVASAGQVTNANGYVIKQRVFFRPDGKVTSAAGYVLKGSLNMDSQ